MAAPAGALAGALGGSGAHDLAGVGEAAAGVAEGAGVAVAGIASGAGQAFAGLGHALGQAGSARDGTLKFSRKERDRVDRKTGHIVPGRASSIEVNPANLAVGAVGLAMAAGIFCMVKHGPINTFLYGCEGAARREKAGAPPGPPSLIDRIFKPPQLGPTPIFIGGGPPPGPQTVINLQNTAQGGGATAQGGLGGQGGAASANPQSYGFGGQATADPMASANPQSYGFGGSSQANPSAQSYSEPALNGPMDPAPTPAPRPSPDAGPLTTPRPPVGPPAPDAPSMAPGALRVGADIWEPSGLPGIWTVHKADGSSYLSYNDPAGYVAPPVIEQPKPVVSIVPPKAAPDAGPLTAPRSSAATTARLRLMNEAEAAWDNPLTTAPKAGSLVKVAPRATIRSQVVQGLEDVGSPEWAANVAGALAGIGGFLI